MTAYDVVVVGAGPGGMAAASTSAHHGSSVCLLDDNETCGGQIWRNGELHDEVPSRRSFIQLRQSIADGQVDLRTRTSVVGQPAPNLLRIETQQRCEDVRYQKLILATGARERFLPFPGWTLPGAMGVGGLQAMVKAGLPIGGKRILLAGSGPLLIAVAAALAREGARVLGILEQAPISRLASFCIRLLRYPGKVRDGASYRAATLTTTPFRTNSWVVRADGDGALQSVTASVKGSIRQYDCDYLGCAFHLVPNLELALLLGCEIRNGFVGVNEFQETSVKGIYCVGEPTGIGGLEKALCEGEIAGLACAGRSATHLHRRRGHYRQFARHLDRAFALRSELTKLPAPETFVCRCEDVSRQALDAMHSWREAKLHTRCGMGPCQGRVCGPATEFLFGWNSAQVRPPIFPVRLSTLADRADAEPLDSEVSSSCDRSG